MGGYIGSSVGNVANAAERKQTYSITTATTSLTGLAYTPTKVHVFHNGVRLVDGTDYTATNGTSITLTNAAQNGDEVVVISYPSFQTSDTVSAANGGTFAGNVAFSGTTTGLDVNGTDLILDADGDSKIEASTDDTITVHTAGSERMRIDSSGNVGIKTTSPVAPLHVDSDNGFGNILLSRDGGAGGRRPFGIGITGSSDADLTISASADTDQAGAFDSDRQEIVRFASDGTTSIGTSLSFGGKVNLHEGGIGVGEASSSGSYRRMYWNNSNNDLRFWNGSNEGTLNSSGAWTDASDISLKKDIADIEYGIDTVKSLQPRKYKMKSDDKDQVGFIAQEMESHVPEIVSVGVTPDGDEHKGIAYGQLTAVLTKALQEAIAKIETLETKVAALEAE